jgi:hypothetical protein
MSCSVLREHVSPSYVLPLPNDINRYINTFLIHPITETRIYYCLNIIHFLHKRISEYISELKSYWREDFDENEGMFAMKPMLYIKNKLELFCEHPDSEIDKLLRLYKYYKTGWYSRDIQRFHYDKYMSTIRMVDNDTPSP